MINRMNLFPTYLWEVASTDIDNDLLKSEILSMEETEPSVSISNFGGWQSRDNLGFDGFLSTVLPLLNEGMKAVMEDLKYSKVSSNLMNMWVNVNRNGHWNTPHLHTGVDFSFCYYVSVPDGSGGICFEDPRLLREAWGDTPSGDHEFFDANIEVTPTPGTMFIFPSYLKHSVRANLSGEPRISISGNIKIEEYKNESRNNHALRTTS